MMGCNQSVPTRDSDSEYNSSTDEMHFEQIPFNELNPSIVPSRSSTTISRASASRPSVNLNNIGNNLKFENLHKINVTTNGTVSPTKYNEMLAFPSTTPLPPLHDEPSNVSSSTLPIKSSIDNLQYQHNLQQYRTKKVSIYKAQIQTQTSNDKHSSRRKHQRQTSKDDLDITLHFNVKRKYLGKHSVIEPRLPIHSHHMQYDLGCVTDIDDESEDEDDNITVVQHDSSANYESDDSYWDAQYITKSSVSHRRKATYHAYGGDDDDVATKTDSESGIGAEYDDELSDASLNRMARIATAASDDTSSLIGDSELMRSSSASSSVYVSSIDKSSISIHQIDKAAFLQKILRNSINKHKVLNKEERIKKEKELKLQETHRTSNIVVIDDNTIAINIGISKVCNDAPIPEGNEDEHYENDTDTDPETAMLDIMSDETSEESIDDIRSFKIIGDQVNVYQDIQLTDQVFSVQLGHAQIVKGEYMDDMRVVLLHKWKLYISSVCVRDIDDQHIDDMDLFIKQEKEAMNKLKEILKKINASNDVQNESETSTESVDTTKRITIHKGKRKKRKKRKKVIATTPPVDVVSPRLFYDPLKLDNIECTPHAESPKRPISPIIAKYGDALIEHRERILAMIEDHKRKKKERKKEYSQSMTEDIQPIQNRPNRAQTETTIAKHNKYYKEYVARRREERSDTQPRIRGVSSSTHRSMSLKERMRIYQRTASGIGSLAEQRMNEIKANRIRSDSNTSLSEDQKRKASSLLQDYATKKAKHIADISLIGKTLKDITIQNCVSKLETLGIITYIYVPNNEFERWNNRNNISNVIDAGNDNKEKYIEDPLKYVRMANITLLNSKILIKLAEEQKETFKRLILFGIEHCRLIYKINFNAANITNPFLEKILCVIASRNVIITQQNEGDMIYGPELLLIENNPISDRGIEMICQHISANDGLHLKCLKVGHCFGTISTVLCGSFCDSLQHNEYILKVTFDMRWNQHRHSVDKSLKKNYSRYRALQKLYRKTLTKKRK